VTKMAFTIFIKSQYIRKCGDQKVPSTKHHKVLQRLEDDNTEIHALVVVGENSVVKHKNAGRDDAGKPLYLTRV